jgi:transcriptional regulator with XRE-family HTH domain
VPPEPYDRVEIGHRIKRLRLAQHMTVQELAKKSEVSPGYLSEVERGLSAISVDKLSQIAQGLGIGVDILLGEDSDTATRQIVQIPAALSAAADQLNLSHRATLTLLKGKQSLTARRSQDDPREWGRDDWLKFYEQVKDYLPEC